MSAEPREINASKRGRGRPRVFSTRIWLPLTQDQLADIDAWKETHMHGGASLQQAIWELVDIALSVPQTKKSIDDIIKHALDNSTKSLLR